jgi:hypothetical protein
MALIGTTLAIRGLDDQKQFCVAFYPKTIFRCKEKARLSIGSVLGGPGGGGFLTFLAERIEKRFATLRKALLEPLCAIAGAASPGLCPILIPAAAPVVGILYLRQIEILFPVGPLFEQRARTVTDFNPSGGLIFAEPRVIHIAEVLVSRNRSPAEGSPFDCLQKVGFAAGFHSCSDEVAHGTIVILPFRSVHKAHLSASKE